MISAFADLPVRALASSYEPVKDGDILVFATMRNEAVRLPAFLDHYRRLGVNRFFVVDNNSTDDTPAILNGAVDVVPFYTAASFRDTDAGRQWTDALRERFGHGHWCLTLDGDEFLCFPAVERFDLHDLSRYFDRCGYEGLFALMLDMYPGGPPADATYQAGGSLVAAFPLFDPAGYDATVATRFPRIGIRGGMRRRVFAEESDDKVVAVLRKTPLIRWRRGISYKLVTHSHSVIRLADVTGVLLHFKYMQNFSDFVTAEVARGDRSHAASYARYAQTASDRPDLTLADANSVRYEDSCQLVRLGLMKSSMAFLNDMHPTLRRRIGGRAAAEFRDRHKAAVIEAARRFQPDLRATLQLWDAFSDPPVA
ncbi:MAG TPA: glycosyltransferase family 2 protein [Acidisphaera sp.]|nr:glycosyltransferase family 2 protein [Acidisphaera sp.]